MWVQPLNPWRKQISQSYVVYQRQDTNHVLDEFNDVCVNQAWAVFLTHCVNIIIYVTQEGFVNLAAFVNR